MKNWRERATAQKNTLDAVIAVCTALESRGFVVHGHDETCWECGGVWDIYVTASGGRRRVGFATDSTSLGARFLPAKSEDAVARVEFPEFDSVAAAIERCSAWLRAGEP